MMIIVIFMMSVRIKVEHLLERCFLYITSRNKYCLKSNRNQFNYFCTQYCRQKSIISIPINLTMTRTNSLLSTEAEKNTHTPSYVFEQPQHTILNPLFSRTGISHETNKHNIKSFHTYKTISVDLSYPKKTQN